MCVDPNRARFGSPTVSSLGAVLTLLPVFIQIHCRIGRCGGFNGNGLQRLTWAWVPAGGTVWERLGGVALLEDVCH